MQFMKFHGRVVEFYLAHVRALHGSSIFFASLPLRPLRVSPASASYCYVPSAYVPQKLYRMQLYRPFCNVTEPRNVFRENK